MNATNPQPASQAGSQIWTWIALAAAAVFVYLVLVPRPAGESLGTKGPAIGRKLPYLQLEPLTGEAAAVTLDDLKDHVTLVNYWGTWCPPCRQEFPHIVDLAHEFADQKIFKLYAVSCGGEGNDEDLTNLRSETMAFLAARSASLSTYADQNSESRRSMAVGLGLEDFGYPTTLVLDQQGVIRGFWVGYTPGTEREMKMLIEELLRKPSA